MIDQNDRELFKGDIGRTIRLAVEFDCTPYTVTTHLVVKCQRPDGTVYTMDATKFTYLSAVDGLVNVVVSTGELTLSGEYLLQLVAAKAGSPTQASKWGSFFVNDVIA